MPEPLTPQKKPLPRWAIPTAATVFIVLFFVLIFSGGQCERYEQKMSRMEHMRHYLDSMRSREQRKRLLRNMQDTSLYPSKPQ